MNPAVERLVSERRGVVTRAELLGRGLTESRLYRQIKRGDWRPVGRRILVHASAPPGFRTDTMVAALWVPDAVLTGPSAALLRPHPAWSGLRFAGSLPSLITARHDHGPFRSVRHPGAVTDVHPLGFRVADPHTALVDLIRFLAWPDAAAVAARAVGLQVTSVAALEESVAALASTEGVAQLRRICVALAKGAESGPEVDLHEALHRAGIRRWQANPVLQFGNRIFRPDVWFPSQRVVIEYDGFAEHSGEIVFGSDRQRGNRFAFAAYVTLHVTKEILYDQREWGRFIADLRQLLRNRRPPRSPRGSAPILGPAPP